jgi:menaquinol-cytochrome c reductase iron-sulfur subunit
VVETKDPTGPPHGPAPSLWPLGFAIGLTVALVGLVIGSWATVAVGAVLLVAFGFVWARDVVTGHDGTPEAPEAETPGPESATTATAAPLPAQVGGPALPVADDDEIEDAMPRSTFLSLTTLGLGGVITGLVAIPVTAFAVAPAFVGQGHDDIDVGPIDQFPEGEFVTTTFLLDPEQGEVSRRTAYIRYNGTKDGEPSFTILSNRCVHLGCPVQVNGLSLEDKKQRVRVPDGFPVELTPTQAASGFGCPCHGGQYDTEGNRTAGPPVRALDRYSYLIKDGRLVLIETYSVGEVEGTGADATIVKYDWVNPSVHVDGPEQVLYPLSPPH